MTIRSSLRSCNYAKSQDRLVTTASESMSDAVTDLKARLGGSFPCTSGEGVGSLGFGALLTIPPSFARRGSVVNPGPLSQRMVVTTGR